MQNNGEPQQTTTKKFLSSNENMENFKKDKSKGTSEKEIPFMQLLHPYGDECHKCLPEIRQLLLNIYFSELHLCF